MSATRDCPSAEDVFRAAERLEGVVHRTPTFTSRTLDSLTGAQVILKAESLQRAGSFKFRGASNAIASLSEAGDERGILVWSSGNHGQACALASRDRGREAVIVMPQKAVAVKVAACRGYGAEVVQFDEDATTREVLGTEIARERDLVIVHPYNHPAIISGQGTASLELLQDHGKLDFLFSPCGGGGLLAGAALAASALAPDCRVVGVEPETADDAARSMRSGTIQSVSAPVTIADGARTPCVGELNFEIFKQHVHDIVTVSDNQIIEAMRLLWERCKLVVEPTGSLALAGLLSGQIEIPPSSRVGVLLSGGNVDIVAASRHFG